MGNTAEMIDKLKARGVTPEQFVDRLTAFLAPDEPCDLLAAYEHGVRDTLAAVRLRLSNVLNFRARKVMIDVLDQMAETSGVESPTEMRAKGRHDAFLEAAKWCDGQLLRGAPEGSLHDAQNKAMEYAATVFRNTADPS